MSYPACFVSWCAMNQEVGANPLWHGCLILSVQMDENSPVQVIDSVGFYGVTPCSDTNRLSRFLKKQIGLNIDLTGGYGELRHEEMRFLDKGVGLEGITFHLSQQQFYKLRQEIAYDIEQQEIAKDAAWHGIAMDMQKDPKLVDKARIALAANNKPFDEQAIYAYLRQQAQEKAKPSEVYQKELAYAQQNRKKPRLKPFEFRTSWTPFTVVTFADSHTCKNVSANLLNRAHIPLEWRKELGLDSSSATMPRYSGKANAEALQLYSEGQYSEHKSSRTAKVHKFREWKPELPQNADGKPKLFWAIPPNIIVANHTEQQTSQAFIDTLTIPAETHQVLSDIMKQLQQTEELLFQSELANSEPKLQFVIDELHSCITAFNIPQKNQDVQYLQKMVDRSNSLLQTIFQAVNSQSKLMSLTEAQKESFSVSLNLTSEEVNKLQQLLTTSHTLPSQEKRVSFA